MPLYSVKTTKTFRDAASELYVWRLFLEADTKEEAERMAANIFKGYIKDFNNTFDDLRNNQVKRLVAFKNNDGLEPLYHAACGEVEAEQVAPGLQYITLIPAN